MVNDRVSAAGAPPGKTIAMTTERKKLGEILVASGAITGLTLQRALERALRQNKKIGTTLEEMGVATGEEIAQALAEQFNCKTIRSFADYSYPPELLRTIPADMATLNFLFPLKRDKRTLYLALADPTATRVVANLAANQKLTATRAFTPAGLGRRGGAGSGRKPAARPEGSRDGFNREQVR